MKLLSACSLLGGVALIVFGFRAFVVGSVDTATYYTLLSIYGILTVLVCDRGAQT